MKKYILILGDILTMLLTTLIGFATHGEVGAGSPGPSIILPRMAAAFFPLTVGWFLLAPWFGLFQNEITSNPKQLWRPAPAMFFAAPLAAILRGLILNAPIIPIFAIVLGATSALGMVVWRALFLVLKPNLH
jgi:hypothetical protein